MRVLVASTAGAGHFGPLVPFARALAAAGHEVVVAAPESFRAAVEGAGFELSPFADAGPAELGRVFATLPDLPPAEANLRVVSEVFGRIAARAALPGMQAVVDEWRPHVVVRETMEFASVAAADRRGVPFVSIGIGLHAFEHRVLPVVEEPLRELGARTDLAGLRSSPRLTLVPESFEDPAAPLGTASTLRFRDGQAPVAAEPLPDWWPGVAGPLVYLTFGSVTATLGLYPDVYRQAIAAVADLAFRVLLTTGEAGDPAELEPLPANVHVERWWPQRSALAGASALVGHGGFGTTLSGLAAGTPMVVTPLFADQPENARRVAATGAGIVLEGGAAAMGGLGDAVEEVLEQPAYRAAAARIAADIAALPPVADAVAVVERVAAAG